MEGPPLPPVLDVVFEVCCWLFEPAETTWKWSYLYETYIKSEEFYATQTLCEIIANEISLQMKFTDAPLTIDVFSLVFHLLNIM